MAYDRECYRLKHGNTPKGIINPYSIKTNDTDTGTSKSVVEGGLKDYV